MTNRFAREFVSLPEILTRWAEERADHVCINALDEADRGFELTFAALDAQARDIASRLLSIGAAGRPVMLLCPSGADFAVAFCGCLYAGCIAVPCSYQPGTRSRERLNAIMRDAEPAAVLRSARHPLPEQTLADPVREIVIEAGRFAGGTTSPDCVSLPAPGRAAFLQYTSGSTGRPKGVIVTHGNLVANLQMIRTSMGVHAGSRFMTWLPLFHDMGLIGNLLNALYTGVSCAILSPAKFIQRPERWLQAVSATRATFSGGPNFAFELCVRSFERMNLKGVDLASWETAFCGAEPVRETTMRRFAALFADYGFRPTALFPCYGLAEATLFVSGGPARTGAKALSAGGASIVSCGPSAPGQTVRIVDPEAGRAANDGTVGEIWLSGANVAAGYWNDPDESDRTFNAFLSTGEGPFLRTGDLAFVQDAEIYITGRLKDLIIHRGVKLHPEDLEYTISTSHPGFGDANAVFSVERDPGEQIVVIQEVARTAMSSIDGASAVRAVMKAMAEHHGLAASEVLLVRPGAIPRTSSGKVQRHRCRDLYLSGDASYRFPIAWAARG